MNIEERELMDKLEKAKEIKGDSISRQAVMDAIQKLNIPEDMCVFEIISHIEVAIATLPSVENKGFDGMTNGEAIQALFPNISVYEHGSTYSVNNEYNFNSTWWNAPYQKGTSE